MIELDRGVLLDAGASTLARELSEAGYDVSVYGEFRFGSSQPDHPLCVIRKGWPVALSYGETASEAVRWAYVRWLEVKQAVTEAKR